MDADPLLKRTVGIARALDRFDLVLYPLDAPLQSLNPWIGAGWWRIARGGGTNPLARETPRGVGGGATSGSASGFFRKRLKNDIRARLYRWVVWYESIRNASSLTGRGKSARMPRIDSSDNVKRTDTDVCRNRVDLDSNRGLSGAEPPAGLCPATGRRWVPGTAGLVCSRSWRLLGRHGSRFRIAIRAGLRATRRNVPRQGMAGMVSGRWIRLCIQHLRSCFRTWRRSTASCHLGGRWGRDALANLPAALG